MEAWRVSRPVVADSYYFKENQDPYPDPHSSKKLDPDPQVKS